MGRLLKLDKNYIYELFEGNNPGEYEVNFPQLSTTLNLGKDEKCFYKRQLTNEKLKEAQVILKEYIEGIINYTEEELQEISNYEKDIVGLNDDKEKVFTDVAIIGAGNEGRSIQLSRIDGEIKNKESLIETVKKSLDSRRLEYINSKEGKEKAKDVQQELSYKLYYTVLMDGKDIYGDMLAEAEKYNILEENNIESMNIEIVE